MGPPVLPGPIASIQVSGSVTNPSASPYLIAGEVPFAQQGDYATLHVAIAAITVGATDPATLYSDAVYGLVRTTVDNGNTPPRGGILVGPYFSITLGQAAVDLANADMAAGLAFGVELFGLGFSGGNQHGDSVFSDLSFVVHDRPRAVERRAAGDGAVRRGPLHGRPDPQGDAVPVVGLRVRSGLKHRRALGWVPGHHDPHIGILGRRPQIRSSMRTGIRSDPVITR
jgi:hypothetical protein